ncbi:MAG: hypothetical protein EBT07_15030, partial [Actinobacteria bacterium]|nr:hypothetical protein [Actinomycetota bacterium]
LVFANDADKELFRAGGTNSPSEVLRRAIFEVLGIRVKYRAATAAAPQMVTEPITKVVEVKEESLNDKRNKLIDPDAQMGDSVLRDILGADPIEGDK